MMGICYCLLLSLTVTINATTITTTEEPGLLQEIIDFLRPYVLDSVVVVANNSLEIDGNETFFESNIDKADSFVNKYHVTEKSNEENVSPKYFFDFLKGRKKKKPPKENAEKPTQLEEKPLNSDDEPPQSEYEPPVHEVEPSLEEIKPSTNEITLTPHFFETKTENPEIKPVEEDGSWEMFPKFSKLPSFFPKRKIVLLTSTVIVTATVTNTIYQTCLEMRRVHSVCEENLITVMPSKDELPLGRTQLADVEDGTADVQVREGEELVVNTTPLIEPTTTIPIEMTKAAMLNESFRKLDVSSSVIEETEPTSEQSTHAETVTPFLIKTINNDSEFSDFRILPYLLKPKVEYTTKFLYVTKTQNVRDFSRTATVIAINCVPVNTRHFPACLTDEPSAASNPVQQYHSNFLQMMKARDQMASFLLKDEIGYLSSVVLPVYAETNKHDWDVHLTSPDNSVIMDENILQHARQWIQDMIYRYVINGWAQRNLWQRSTPSYLEHPKVEPIPVHRKTDNESDAL